MPPILEQKVFPEIPVICLAGSTGVGKTELAIELAQCCDGEIINGDSRQLYEDLPIVTAQPDAKQLRQVPHHLYGILPASVPMSAGEWVNSAVSLSRDIYSRGRLPLIVGGTGFYFEALLRGLADMPHVPEELRANIGRRLEQEGSEKLHADLANVDPEYAAKIHPRDRQRVQRAWEIYEASGHSFSWWHSRGRQKPPLDGPLLVLNIDLDELTPRLAKRIDLMLKRGAVEEMARAYAICPDAKAPAFSGIGCRELLGYLHGELDLEECKRQWLASTRAYAKRQRTWFRGRPNAIWLANGHLAEVLEVTKPFLSKYLQRIH